MTNNTVNIPNTDKEAAASGYDIGYGTPTPDWQELNVGLFTEAYERIGALETTSESTRTLADHYSSAVINVAEPPYNAPEDPNGNATDAVQRAIDDLPAEGGTLVFPYMVKVTDTLDATNRGNIRWFAPYTNNAGSAVRDNLDTGGIMARTIDNKPIIDTTGSYTFLFDGINIRTPSVDTPNKPSIGVLMARSQSQSGANAHYFNNVYMLGKVTKALLYNISKEVGAVRDCFFMNTEADSRVIDVRRDNAENITSPYATINPVTTQTRWLYISNSFTKYTPGTCLRISHCQNHSFQDNYWYNTDGPAVEIDTRRGAIAGPLSFRYPRMEGGENAGPFLSQLGTDEIKGVSLIGGTPTGHRGYPVTTPTVDLPGPITDFHFEDRTGFGDWGHGGMVLGPLKHSTITSVSGADITVDDVTNSTINIINPKSTFTNNGFPEGSMIHTQEAEQNGRYNLTDNTLQMQPRDSPPAETFNGTLAIQDGTNWDPAGTGRTQLVIKDGSTWKSAS